MEFSQQEYWSGLPIPTLRDRPEAGIKPLYLASPELASGFFTTKCHLESLSISLVGLYCY